jgi:tRNA(Ile)-lysidine synthase
VARVKGDLRGIGFVHVEELAALAASEEGHGRIQIPGVDAMRSFEWLRLAPTAEPFCRNRNFSFEVTPPGEVRIPGTGRSVVLQFVDLPQSSGESPAPAAGSPYNESSGDLDGDRLAGPFMLRNWRPGDQYRPAGADEHRKIKMLFQEARIPLWERASWPVLAQGGRILWTRRFGPAADVAASPTCRRVLRVSESEEFRQE